jgi:hypothetical protein
VEFEDPNKRVNVKVYKDQLVESEHVLVGYCLEMLELLEMHFIEKK